MNPTLRYFLSLTLRLASNQLHTSNSKCQGSHSNAGEWLSSCREKILARLLCHMEIKVFGSNGQVHRNFLSELFAGVT